MPVVGTGERRSLAYAGCLADVRPKSRSVKKMLRDFFMVNSAVLKVKQKFVNHFRAVR